MVPWALALIAVGGVAVVVAVVGAYRVGRFVTNMEGLQMRSTLRELGQARRSDRRQLKAVDDALSRLLADPSTPTHVQHGLEKLRGLTAARDP